MLPLWKKAGQTLCQSGFDGALEEYGEMILWIFVKFVLTDLHLSINIKY